nr:helix-turn-helix transcriptional regulator [Fournierella massiliensis]
MNPDKRKRRTDMNAYITGNTIRKLREAKKLTQVQLAEKLDVSDKAVSKWETGVSQTKGY